jgi:hypothetical protein
MTKSILSALVLLLLVVSSSSVYAQVTCVPFTPNTALPIDVNDLRFSAAATMTTDPQTGYIRLGQTVTVEPLKPMSVIGFQFMTGSVPDLLMTVHTAAGASTFPYIIPGTGGSVNVTQPMQGVSKVELSASTADSGYAKELMLTFACPTLLP